MLTRIVNRSTSNLRCIHFKQMRQRAGATRIPRRRLATVASEMIIIGPPPNSPADPVVEFDRHLLSVLQKNSQKGGQKCLKDLVQDYFTNSGRVLNKSLKYESRPSADRKLMFETESSSSGDGNGIVMVVHCVKSRSAGEVSKIVSCSGFVIDVDGGLVVTCAHTLEDIRRSPLLQDESGAVSGSFIVFPSTNSASGVEIRSVTAIPSSLPRSDILLLSPSPSDRPLRSLPVSPYPLSSGLPLRAHFITEASSILTTRNSEEWAPWIGGTRRQWVKGEVKGYRDFAGREAQPGTYDALNHLLFTPPPTPGSSGGPIADESGAIVGIILGSRMDSRVEGVRGWGVPGEAVFEMFSLPGLEGKQ